MNPSDRNAPLSPVSVGGSEWSFAKYQTNDDGQYPNRGNLISPPSSGGSPENMSMNGFPTGPRSAGGPSPPPSVGRSSNGTNMFSRNDGPRNGPRSDADEGVLHEHYIALRAFLTARDPNNKQQPNKARDKLLRLSMVQFFELSTDVFDELMRRQALARTPPGAPNIPPNFLLPEKTFHPKRNQARQRLSSLGPPRFRDLGADVFHELERRYPNFVGGEIPRVGSSMSNRSGPMNRMGTPINGSMFPPRGESRMRRPSEAGSLRGGPPPMDPYGIPPSPNLPNGDYARPMPRQPTQNNTIVPNKSTMIEEDDETGDAFSPDDRANNQENKRMSTMTSETDRKIIEEYQTQLRELQEKLDSMGDAMKKKEDEMSSALDNERSRATAAASEKLELADARSSLEDKLNEAQNLNNSLRQELERMRDDHDLETNELREQVQQSASRLSSAIADEELKRENEKLRYSLQQQQRVTDEVRSEAQEFLREMRMLSQQSGSTYEKQVEMEKTIEQLEHEVREWRNRYARTKTQLRNMKGSSVGLTMDNAAKYVRDRGFLEDSGLVKDVHVTKFQIAIDELLQRAREETPDEIIDAMKSVIVSVRRITRDIDESTPHSSDPNQRGKLRAKVSATANSLITASKNFASSAGIAPVSLIDAAASHLTVAIVDLLRVAKIRPTPAVELEDEDDQSVTPVDSTGFFSPRSVAQESTGGHDALPPPPVFQGLGGIRASAESSAYSPVSSPRASVDAYAEDANTGMATGALYIGVPGNANGYEIQPDENENRLEDLKIYLEDQNALLVPDIQNLVNCVRSEANISQISTEIESISVIVGKMISETQKCGHADMVGRITDSRSRLLDANHRGQEMAASNVRSGDGDWRTWAQSLPPMAFEIARESKDLVQRIGRLTTSREPDDFS